MTPLPMAKKLVLIGAMAVGALSLGTAGMAGAATTGTPAAPATSSPLTHFNCAKATKALTRIERGEARISAGLPKLTAAEAKATKAGHTRRAKRLEKRITRLEGSKYHARLTTRSAAIQAKCHVPAPSATTSSSTSTTA